MSAFIPGDRARCVQANSSDLTLGALYYVVAVRLTASGTPILYLLGQDVPVRADRFLRVPVSDKLWPDGRYWEGRE